MTEAVEQVEKRGFPGQFWLVVMFEFFERGAYYGMMSVLSVYFTDVLLFPKESVGLIKSVIQPILYFLPIVAGALADRFGYRKALTVAFALLGTGYFLTAQATQYTAVFLALVVMALGAGTFKPLISGTIARCTDKENSTLGFGIYYWSINLGAFLFPLVLVPWLKNSLGWPWIMLAAALCTGGMLVPTLLFFREPVTAAPAAGEKKTNLVQTVANAFEIIYSPFVLIYQMARRSRAARTVIAVASLLVTFWAVQQYWQPATAELRVTAFPHTFWGQTLFVTVARNQSAPEAFELSKALPNEAQGGVSAWNLTVFRPSMDPAFLQILRDRLRADLGWDRLDEGMLRRILRESDRQILVGLTWRRSAAGEGIDIVKTGPVEFQVTIRAPALDGGLAGRVAAELRRDPMLAAADPAEVESALAQTARRPFLALFVVILYFTSLIILAVEGRVKAMAAARRRTFLLAFAAGMAALLWLLPGLTVFARILCSVIYLTALALFRIDFSETDRFKDHFKFLLMIFLYSGFWVMYFQMFDSVLWYVQAYVDATPLNNFVNSIVAALGIGWRWRFDVEHVTVINAGTIIALQLIVSKIVEKRAALPTMITGILFGTLGFAILAISPQIWIFMLGNVVFSIGEMTAHPKFISYIGQTAPRARVALYMGYIFLYGVIGSSIAGVLGANLYVRLVDQANQPRALWLIFAGIGVATMIGLLLYNRFLAPRGEEETA
jgi:dipeptide/tripeptide permease